jgi:hypothetical protein
MTTEHGGSIEKGEVPPWQEIEKHLVGIADLSDLIDRLSPAGPHGVGSPPPILDVLGEHRQAILEQGLSAAPSGALDRLLHNPELLRDLQGLIFAAGGEYWTKQIDQAAARLPAEYRAMIQRIRDDLERRMRGE